MSRRLFRIAVAGMLLSTPLLAGCNEEESPVPAPLPSSESPTVDEPAEPEAPELPAAAAADTNAGAQAFVEYFFSTLSYAIVTGDTALMRRSSANKCGSCSGIADAIDELYEDGTTVESDGWIVKRIRYLARTPDDEPTFHLRIRISAETNRDSSGDITRESGDSTGFFFVYASRQDDGWLVRDFESTEDRL